MNIRITGKDLAKAAQIAAMNQGQGFAEVNGVVDARILQRQNYPEFIINVDRTKAADLGMTQEDVMHNVVAARSTRRSPSTKGTSGSTPKAITSISSASLTRKRISQSVETMLDIPITGAFEGRTGPACGPWPTITRTDRADRDHAQQHPARHRPDDGRRGARPRPRPPTISPGCWKEFGEPSCPMATWAPFNPSTSVAKRSKPETLKGLQDRLERRVCPDAANLPRPGNRHDPGRPPDVLPDGRARQVLHRAADGHADRADQHGGRVPDALPDGNGDQRSVHSGDHLHHRDQGGQHGVDDGLSPRRSAATRD